MVEKIDQCSKDKERKNKKGFQAFSLKSYSHKVSGVSLNQTHMKTQANQTRQKEKENRSSDH